MFDRLQPFNKLGPIPRGQLETRVSLKQALSASRMLSELRAAGPTIPNQAVLLRALQLQEAQASSEIENIVTTADELYRAIGMNSDLSDPQTKEVLRYNDALWHGYHGLRSGASITPEMILEIARIVRGGPLEYRDGPGVQVANRRTGEVVYTPPTGRARLMNLIQDLCRFLADPGEVDPLIAVAASHRQFEAIHPFPDGNGRTGRIFVILGLVQQGLLDLPVLYLSGHLLRHRAEYYHQLARVTETGNWQDWLVFMLAGIERTAERTLRLVRAVRDARDSATDLAREQMVRGYSRELIDSVFSQPYSRIKHVMDDLGVSRNTAGSHLAELVRLGILVRVQVGKEHLFQNPALLRALSLGLSDTGT